MNPRVIYLDRNEGLVAVILVFQSMVYPPMSHPYNIDRIAFPKLSTRKQKSDSHSLSSPSSSTQTSRKQSFALEGYDAAGSRPEAFTAGPSV